MTTLSAGRQRSVTRGVTVNQSMPVAAPVAEPRSTSARIAAASDTRSDTAMRSLTNALADIAPRCDSSPRNVTSQTRAGRPFTTSAKTGCGLLVNTSFNVRSEPIVCTPEDAYRCFMRTAIDILVLENCLLHKADQKPLEGDTNWQEEFELD